VGNWDGGVEFGGWVRWGVVLGEGGGFFCGFLGGVFWCMGRGGVVGRGVALVGCSLLGGGLVFGGFWGLFRESCL